MQVRITQAVMQLALQHLPAPDQAPSFQGVLLTFRRANAS